MNDKSEPNGRRIVITVDDAHLADVEQVADRLRARGMAVDGVLEATGLITGSAAVDPSVLGSVRGVASVEEETQFQLPPPDSAAQ